VSPIPLNLPVRPYEAAELGRLIFEEAEPGHLTAEIRERLAKRAAALALESVTPYFGSLVRDPVHPSVYYLAVDAAAAEAEERSHWLLHIAPAASPTSSVFHMPLLLGRLRTEAGRELVVNALPFGPADEDSLDRFTAELDPSVLPRVRGLKPAIAVPEGLQEAFAAFRKVWKRTGTNLAAVTAAAGGAPPRSLYYSSLWAAIREGWREGYSARLEIRLEDHSHHGPAQTIRSGAHFSHFAIDIGKLIGRKGSDEEFAALQTAARIYQVIGETRSSLKIPRAFDFELSFQSAPHTISAESIAGFLSRLKESGCPAQFVRPPAGSSISGMSAAARDSQCLLSLRESPKWPPTGTIYYQLSAGQENLCARIVEAAAHLAG